jgi:hypothetical protein
LSIARLILSHWERARASRSRRWFLVKTLYFIATIVVGLMNNLALDATNIVLSGSLLAFSGCLDLLAYSLLIFLPAGGLLYALAYLTYGFKQTILHNYLYGFNTFLAVEYLVATTSPDLLAGYLDRVGLGLVVRLVNNVFWELEGALDSKRARGVELKWSVKGQAMALIDAVKIMAKRLNELDTALKARGLE